MPEDDIAAAVAEFQGRQAESLEQKLSPLQILRAIPGAILSAPQSIIDMGNDIYSTCSRIYHNPARRRNVVIGIVEYPILFVGEPLLEPVITKMDLPPLQFAGLCVTAMATNAFVLCDSYYRIADNSNAAQELGKYTRQKLTNVGNWALDKAIDLLF